MIYRLLGPLEVARSTARGDAAAPSDMIDLGPRKQRIVLAVLLLNRGRVVSTDRLIDALWRDDAPASATASIQAYISNLRRALRADSGATSPIVRQPPGYVLDIAPADVDLSVFLEDAEAARAHTELGEWDEALTIADRALFVVRGHLLEDLGDEAWVAVDAAAFEEVRTECRESRITALLAVGRLASALNEAAELCSEYPLRDRTCWLRMLALHRAGRSSEALDGFLTHASRLDTELGLAPGTELTALRGAILRHDPGLAAWPRTPRWSGAQEVLAPTTAPPVPDAPVLGPGRVFVGRTSEASTIDRLLAEVAGGAPRWLVLTGPAGIGKTRLAEECDARTELAGGTAVWVRCLEDVGAPPWWPIRRLLWELGVDVDAVLVPPAAVEPDEARFAVYERVLQAIKEYASTVPTLTVVIDDVQWADPTSVRALMYLAGALHRERVWFVLTLRDSEVGPDVEKLVDTILHGEGNRHLTVSALAPSEVATLASCVSGEQLDEGEIRVLAERTGGNPLFVSEYARLPRTERFDGEIPMAVRSVLGRRLASVELAVLQVLRVAAVIGDTIEIDTLSAATRLDLDTLADYLDEAADERIIVAEPGIGGYVFAHGLLRDEVLEAIPALRRQRIHAQVAEVLKDSSDADRSTRRAKHLVSALPVVDPRVVLDACIDAARDSTERGSSETAAQWWESAVRAFDLLPASMQFADNRDDLLVGRVEALARAGRGQTVLDVVDSCLLDAAREGRISALGRLAAALLRTAGAWPWVSYGEDPGPLIERLAAIEPLVAHDQTAHVRVLAALAVGSCYHPDSSVPDASSARALDMARELVDPEVVADALLGRILLYSGVASRSHESMKLIGELLDLPHQQSRVDNVIAHTVASMTQLNLADADAAAMHVRRGIIGCDMSNLPVLRVQLRWMEGTLATWHGDFEEVRRQYDTAKMIHLQTELYMAGSAGLAENTLEWELGTLAQADPGIVEPDSWSIAIAGARGERERASREIALWLAKPGTLMWTTLGHQTLIARVVADLGLVEYCEEFIGLLAPYVDRIATVGQVGVIGSVAEVSARLHAMVGSMDTAAVLLDRAEEIARRTSSPATLLRCHLLRTQLLPSSPVREHAIAEISDESERLGMHGLAAYTRSILA